MKIEVRVAGRGVARGDDLTMDPNTVAHCSVCGKDVDLVVSLTENTFTCRPCIRERLDATSVAGWRLGEQKGLPWGKVAG
ncbi:MAG: hypothetical protein AB2A00_29255 [Myxococcota bacterium]